MATKVKLNKLKSIIELKNNIIRNINDPDYLDKVCKHFPFSKLNSMGNASIEVISALTDILVLLIQCGKITDEIVGIIYFYVRLIITELSSTNINFDRIETLLKILCVFLEMAQQFEIKIYDLALIQLVSDMVLLPNVTSGVIEPAVLVFMQLLPSMTHADQKNFTKQILRMYQSAPCKLSHVAFTAELLQYADHKNFSLTYLVYNHVIESVDVLHTVKSSLVKSYIIKCLSLFYEKCEDQALLYKISEKLMKNNFPESIQQYYISDKMVFAAVIRIYRCAVRRIFKQYTNDCFDKSDGSFKYLKYYLQIVYTQKHHDKGTAIALDIAQRFEENIPIQNPALLKSLYLLCAIYGDKNGHQFPNLMKSLEDQPNIQDYVTFHIAQFEWVLKFGEDSTKEKMVILFVAYYRPIKDILDTFDSTREYNCLIDVIRFNDCENLQLAALSILEYSTFSETLDGGISINFSELMRELTPLLYNYIVPMSDELMARILKYIYCILQICYVTGSFIPRFIACMISFVQSDNQEISDTARAILDI